MSWEICWADMCRACMEVEGDLLSLYDEDSEINELSSKLVELTSVEIGKFDGLPTKLCEKCAYRTNAFFQFKCLVRESDKKLRHMFNQQVVSDIKDDQMENQVVDHVDNTCTISENSTDLIDDISIISKNHLKKESYIETEENNGNHSNEKNISVFKTTTFNNLEKVSDTIILKVEDNLNDTSDINNSTQDLQVVFHANEFDQANSNFTLSNNFNNFQSIEDQTNYKIEEPNILALRADEFLKIEKNEDKLKKNETNTVCIQTPTQVIKDIDSTADQSFENSNPSFIKVDYNDSDSDSYIEMQENIVGSLNDTITKVKEIKEGGKVVQYQCTLCLQNYKVLSEILSHIVDLHIPSTGPFYCVVCEMDCNSIKQLKTHVKIHQGASPYICFLCNKSYVMKRYLKRHMACHTDFPRYRCAKCSERFKTKNELEDHITSHTQGAPFRCSQCPRVFNHKGNYKRHLISHLDPQGLHLPKYPCNICNKRFLNNRILTNHMRVHTGEKPYKCELCGKAFSQQGNLFNHQKIHNNPRSFTCEVCGKSFNQKATLRDHASLHSGEKPYVCAVCGIAFTFSAALRRHMWTHSDGKPFECDVCNAKFIGRYDLKRHMNIHSGRSNLKRNKTTTKENAVEIPEEIINIAQDTSNTDTIFVEQIFLCDDSIQIISQEDSEKENVESLLGFIQYE